MEKNKWLTSKDLMDRWQINEPTLADLIFSRKLKVRSLSNLEWCDFDPAQKILEKGIAGSISLIPGSRDIIFGADRDWNLRNIMKNLEDFICSQENAIEFEADYPSIIEAKEPGKDLQHEIGEAENWFKKEGESWNISFQGKHFHLANSRGLIYIHFLLERPGEKIEAFDLFQMGKTVVIDSEDYQKMSDEQFREYGLRKGKPNLKLNFDDLKAELEKEKDLERKAILKQEIDLLSQNGGLDQAGEDTSDKAVRVAIKRAFDQIKEHHASLADYLRRTIKTGTSCIYHPILEMSFKWIL